MYLIRLDDACEYMDTDKWGQIERMLDRYNIAPIVGVISHCEDPKMKGVYEEDSDFWRKVSCWQQKKWAIALHGYNHLYITDCAGINPLHNRSEFAGVPLKEQKEKIRNGIKIFKSHGLSPHIFFAPGHTFDKNTLRALHEESKIQIICDTIAGDVYYEDGFWFIPQQCGSCRKLSLKTAVFCYHPNTMQTVDFDRLEAFLKVYSGLFCSFDDLHFDRKKQRGLLDRAMRTAYFIMRKLRGR